MVYAKGIFEIPPTVFWKDFKTKSDRKLDNFSFKWTKIWYEDNFKYFTVLCNTFES